MGRKPTIYSDFVFDPDLDESLFSLEPPAGYTIVNQTLDCSPAEEKELLETLRRYGQLSGGASGRADMERFHGSSIRTGQSPVRKKKLLRTSSRCRSVWMNC